jgi:2-polyprenyl-6-methoxyphenol hydroxylase-like FAD-dependent oxidoreductase
MEHVCPNSRASWFRGRTALPRAERSARVEFGTELIAVEESSAGLRVTLRDVGGRPNRVVDASYLIGADGVRSTVRQALGIRMRGPDRLVEAVSTLFHAPLWERVGDAR